MYLFIWYSQPLLDLSIGIILWWKSDKEADGTLKKIALKLSLKVHFVVVGKPNKSLHDVY